VESEVGKGSTFHVLLPVHQEQASKPKRTDVFPATTNGTEPLEKIEKVV
jgi:hypothetical protein